MVWRACSAKDLGYEKLPLIRSPFIGVGDVWADDGVFLCVLVNEMGSILIEIGPIRSEILGTHRREVPGRACNMCWPARFTGG